MRYSFDIEVGSERLTVLAKAESEIQSAAGNQWNKLKIVGRRNDVFPNKMDYDVCLPEEAEILVRTLERSN